MSLPHFNDLPQCTTVPAPLVYLSLLNVPLRPPRRHNRRTLHAHKRCSGHPCLALLPQSLLYRTVQKRPRASEPPRQQMPLPTSIRYEPYTENIHIGFPKHHKLDLCHQMPQEVLCHRDIGTPCSTLVLVAQRLKVHAVAGGPPRTPGLDSVESRLLRPLRWIPDINDQLVQPWMSLSLPSCTLTSVRVSYPLIILHPTLHLILFHHRMIGKNGNCPSESESHIYIYQVPLFIVAFTSVSMKVGKAAGGNCSSLSAIPR
jgi:hypothetical protein